MESTAPTGRVEMVGGSCRLEVGRELEAGAEEVWAAVTDPTRLGRWIGTWTGDPQTKQVTFQMTFEEGADAELVDIRECTPPHRLALTMHAPQQQWEIELDLSERDGRTALTLTQPGLAPEEVEHVGPGWEYYLDRLVAAETGGDPAQVDFARDYYPAMQDHYRAQAQG